MTPENMWMLIQDLEQRVADLEDLVQGAANRAARPVQQSDYEQLLFLPSVHLAQL